MTMLGITLWMMLMYLIWRPKKFGAECREGYDKFMEGWNSGNNAGS